MVAIVAANGKTSCGRTLGVHGAHRALTLFNVAGRTDLTVRPDGKHRHRSPVVVGYQHMIAGRMHAQVGRPGPPRADSVEQCQIAVGPVDRERAHRTGGRTLKSWSLIRRV